MAALKAFILSLTPEHARTIGIQYRSTLAKLKERAAKPAPLNLKTREVRKAIAYLQEHN
jgi:hypothetical protein